MNVYFLVYVFVSRVRGEQMDQNLDAVKSGLEGERKRGTWKKVVKNGKNKERTKKN